MATATVRSPAHVEIATVSVAGPQHQTIAGTVTARDIDLEMKTECMGGSGIIMDKDGHQLRHADKINNGHGKRQGHRDDPETTTDGRGWSGRCIGPCMAEVGGKVGSCITSCGHRRPSVAGGTSSTASNRIGMYLSR